MGAPRPRPAPAPVFHRQAPVASPDYSYDAYSHSPQSQHSQYSQRSQHSYVTPPAPNSLAPVEMSSYSQAPRSYQTDRGVAHTNTANVKPRPSWRTGAMILLAGVFVGGTFGIGVQARRNALDEQANLANAAVNVAPAVQPLAPAQQPGQQLAIAAPGPTALQPATPPQAPPQAYAQAPGNPNLPPGAIVIPPQQGVVVVPPPQPQATQAQPQAAQQQPSQAHAQAQVPVSPPAKKAPAWRPAPPPPRQPSATLAAKVTPPKKEVAEPADPPEPAPKKGPKKPQTDAQSVLQAAIGETTNTL